MRDALPMTGLRLAALHTHGFPGSLAWKKTGTSIPASVATPLPTIATSIPISLCIMTYQPAGMQMAFQKRHNRGKDTVQNDLGNDFHQQKWFRVKAEQPLQTNPVDCGHATPLLKCSYLILNVLGAYLYTRINAITM